MTPSERATELATFGIGCFWCGEAVFERIEGVTGVVSGYMGGSVKAPTYEQVCTGETGHAEVIQIRFDPSRVTFKELLDIFWQAHDPTQLNRQGADIGTQYRSAIFYHSDAQRETAEASMKEAQTAGKHEGRIVTEITEASPFYEAELKHQGFYDDNKSYPYCRFVIAPKLKKLRLDD